MEKKDEHSINTTKVVGIPAIDIDLPNDLNSLLLLIKRIFSSSGVLTRSQYTDINKSSSESPEIKLWINILELTMEDWLNYKEDQSQENYRRMKEIEEWAFKNSFGIEMLAVTMYILFRIDTDHFKSKFRMWLRRNRPIRKKRAFPLKTPFESFETIGEIYE